jgi:hypothetical protein
MWDQMWSNLAQGPSWRQPQPMAMMPGNPMLEGLLAVVAAQNPEVVANAAAEAGIPPPSMAPGVAGGVGSVGSYMQPQGMVVPGAQETQLAAAGNGIGPWQTTVIPNAVPDGMQDNRDPLAGLAGFRAPQIDNRPIMNAGVSGAQKAPEVSLAGSTAANQQLNQLLQVLLARQQGPQVGSLGSFIGG